MKNNNKADLLEFIPATQRVVNLVNESLNVKPELCIERARILTECDRKFQALPAPIRRARSLSQILQKMSIFIGDEELIVGNQARKLRASPFFPEYAVEYLEAEIDTLNKRKADPFILREEDKEEFREIIEYWRSRTHEKKVDLYETEKLKKALAYGPLLGAHLLCSGHGHISVGYEKVLKIGLNGFLAEIETSLSKLDLLKLEDIEKWTFLTAAKELLSAVIDFAGRFAVLALEKAKTENEIRRKELEKIAEICKNVPANPANTFYEALQSIWFVSVVLQIESNGHSITVGRLDQYLEPYFTRETEEGTLDYRQAQELLGCLFIKMHSVNKLRSNAATQYASGYPTYQNVTVGGQKDIGIDGVNDVTYLIINAMENVRFPSPNLTARFWSGSSNEYMKKCVDSMSLGFGMPALLDDEVIIPSLLARGVNIRDAYNYCAMGCVEIGVSGKWGYRETGMTFFNFLKVLEIAIHGGKDPVNGNYTWGETKSLAEMESFDELKEAWEKYIELFVNYEIQHDAFADHCLRELPDVFCSALVEDCIERGKMLLEGGAVYDMLSGDQIGIANVANSMAAIKKLVFDDQYISGEKMLNFMDNNFEGEGGESLRQVLLNKVPKYGNDDDYADELAVWAYEAYMDEVEKYKNTREGKGPVGCGYFASTVGITSNMPCGKQVGATPDGRKAFQPTAEGASPQVGTDTHGPTAVLKSVAKIPAIRMTGGQLLNLKFSPGFLAKDNEKWKLVDMIRSFGELKGWHVQLNVVSRDTLREAQKNPQNYKNLMVRVAGYCALFTELDPETQNDIIARTEHTAF